MPVPHGKGWKRDLTQEGIEPHPGPRSKPRRSQHLTILQLNINGKNNLWNLGHNWSQEEVDVVCIQESHMSQSESNNFAQYMWKKGWVTYAVPSTRSRGVATLVRKCWKSCRLFDVDNQGGQFLAVQVGHVTIGNLYAAHDTERETCTSEVFEFLHSLGPSRWCLTGDFNDPPSVPPGTWSERQRL